MYFILVLYTHLEAIQFKMSQKSFLSSSFVYIDFQFGKLFTQKRKEKKKSCFCTFWYIYTTSLLPVENMQGIDYIAVSILMFNSSRAMEPCLYMAWLTLPRCISLLPMSLLNSSQMQVQAGIERGFLGGRAASAAAVRKPRKRINLSKRSL